ncbi:hypothetical protein SISSUDRAFT_1045804 [Sistotremastrum suecicum HHB10207 ss-3]|uniref:Uncharacterized protein n=1 Tax=Sistotremastrum suecicum HHB10207 ss-3 TaxID=1314776 RepID=A0A166E941_9AGAM|nr:hypothetical protein SISSUDRAFT_1045804 [Sistotremastrum suecicum HHB10207 ss-3]
MVQLESGTQADQDGEEHHDEVPLLRGAAHHGNRDDGERMGEDVEEEDRKPYSCPAPSYHEVAQSNTPPPLTSSHIPQHPSRTDTRPNIS